MANDLFQNYIKEIYKLIERGDAREESFYSILQNLIEVYGQNLKKKTKVTVLPKKSEAGNPDFRVWDGESLITGYIEAKHPSERNLEHIESSEQLKRYREAYPNLILTNFLEFRLYRNGICWKEVNIGNSQLAKISPEQGVVLHKEELQKLLNLFFDFTQPRIKTPRILAETLSKKAKIMRDYIILPTLETEPYFANLYNSFKNYLIRELKPDEFADLFAQTFTYGLFIAKYHYETKIKTPSLSFTTKTAYDFIQQNFGILREVFRVISTGDMPKNLEIIVDDIIDILNHTDIIKLLTHYSEEKRKDPIYHLYETFLENYDPERRKKLGVYYTPPQVVSFIVNSVNTLLKDEKLFNTQDGLASYKTDSLENSVTLLDPAVGTGTFFVEAIEKAIEEAKNKYSESKDFINQFIRNHILKHFFAFEILIAPYVVSHLKTLFNLTNNHHFEFTEKDDLNIFLTNTLQFYKEDEKSDKEGFARKYAGVFEKVLVAEQDRALKVKQETPILIIIGNPPYSVSSQNEVDLETDFGKFYESYKENVRREEKNIQPLSDDYIKFLAFAHWKIEQTGKGIVGMITNNSYLDGIIHRDMREKLYNDFDLIYILNLHGSTKRLKLTKDGKRDENVFDIKQGVAIAIFVKPEKQIAKQIFYQELIGLREEKYKFLDTHDVSNVQWIKLEPKEPHWFFVPKEFGGEEKYKKFLSLKEIFTKYNAGIATGKDEVLVDFDKNRLIRKFSARDKALFELSFQNYITTNLIEKWYNEIQTTQIEKQVIPYYYRPFDIRFTIYNPKILQRARKDLMDHLVKPNMALVVTKILSSESFQHAFIADGVGDRTFISTRGKEANYYFPLWLYNSNAKTQNQLPISPQPKDKTPNINQKVIDLLSSSYKNLVSPEETFYYIYAVLYSNIYRKKYLEFLKIDFPRMPFTNDYKLFKKLSGIGKQLIDIHLLKPEFLKDTASRFEGDGNGLVKKVIYNIKEKRVYINENQFFTNIEPEIWNYFIGGYQVLNKWLKDRKGEYLTDEEIKNYIKIISALNQTIIAQKEIDKLYPKVEKDLITLQI